MTVYFTYLILRRQFIIISKEMILEEANMKFIFFIDIFSL
jgi:hypothetical protein